MIARHDLQNQTSLDPYLAPEERPKTNVFFVSGNLVNVNLQTNPARRTFSSKVDDFTSAVHELAAREKYALDYRLRDEVFMKGIVESEDEYTRVKKVAHRTGRIREEGHVNGAWVTDC
jgi:hypothetical protein